MNSLLQQIFHIKHFTNNLLNIDTTASSATNDNKNDNTNVVELYEKALKIEPEVEVQLEVKPLSKEELLKIESQQILFQLQVLFSYLLLSQKKYYDTLPFCRVIKDYDGEVLSLSEQKDINEFAGIIVIFLFYKFIYIYFIMI